MKYKIESLDPENYNELIEIFKEHQLYHQHLKGYPYPKRFDTNITRYESEMEIGEENKEAKTFIVKSQKGDLIGFIGITISKDNRAYIQDLSITKEYRRQGIGRDLLQTSIDWAKQKGTFNFDIHTSVGNEGALELYKSLGFKIIGHTYKKMIQEKKVEYEENKKIQLLKKDEYDQLKNPYEERRKYYGTLDLYPYPEKEKNRTFVEFEKQLIGKKGIVKVVRKEEKIIGYIVYQLEGNNEDIKDIWVTPPYRNNGIGSKLFQEVMEEATAKGVTEFNISTYLGNEKGKRILKNQGFYCTGYNLSIEQNTRIKEREI